MIHSGVECSERAKAGIGCIVNRKMEKSIKEWKCVNERLMIIKIEDTANLIANIMILYGPNEDNSKRNKDEFWNTVQLEYEKLDEPIYLMGDCNARVGNNNKGLEDVMGRHGEPTKNNNGNRLIDFCIVNELIILNTIFEHKEIHKFTREERNRNEKSIIDYILTNRSERKKVNDVKVNRGSEIGTDHYLVVAQIKARKEEPKPSEKITKKLSETIKFRVEKLKEKHVREKYQNSIKTLIKRTPKPDMDNVDEIWNTFKRIIAEATECACGRTRSTHNRKQTHWWNEKVKVEVKKKKQKWRKYLNTKNAEDYEEYRKQRKITKDTIKKAKEKTWEEFGEKMEENFKENEKLFYRTLKRNKGEKQISLKQLKDKQGKVINEENEIMKRWKEHFEELLEGTQSDKKTGVNESIGHDKTTRNKESGNITGNEMKNVLKKLKNGKAPGHDNMKPEQLKYMGEEGEQILLEMLNRIWELGRIPEDWRKAVILPIYKKGDSRDYNNYRGISLLCTTAKVYEAIIEDKLRLETEKTLERAQSGFRKGHSTQDHIFVLRKLIENTREKNSKLFIAFIDLEKAFDRVPRQKVWEVLEKRKVNEHLLKAVKSLYRKTTNYIRTGNEASAEFETTKGLRQGGALSPLLFIIFLDNILKQIKDKTKKVEIGHHNLRRIVIAECAFADDLAILAKSEEDLQTNINIWNEELGKHNMTINIEKTKIMVIATEEVVTEITLNGKLIEQVESFKYLGTTLDNKGSLEEEINNRIQAANKTYFMINKLILSNKQVSKRTKMTLYKTIYRPTLIYGSEAWVLNQRTKSKLQAAEMKFLRKVEGLTRLDRVRNEQIRTSLQIESIQMTIEKRQLAWYGHLIRMPEDRQTKIVWNTKIARKKKRGRPQKTWKMSIEEILKRNNISVQKAGETARNRVKWKEMINKIK